MAVKRGGLGKGLDSLIPDTGKTAEKEKMVWKLVENDTAECPQLYRFIHWNNRKCMESVIFSRGTGRKRMDTDSRIQLF